MRTMMRRISKLMAFVSLILCGSAFLVVFQNCGSYQLGSDNPLLGTEVSSFCLGINCQNDVNTAIIRAPNSGVMIDPKSAAGIDLSVCDSTQCFDVGGYCEDGGYAQTTFYYQWLLVSSTGPETKSVGTDCDDNGRFHLQVHVPINYDHTKINHLRVFMKVIDEHNVEIASPTGAGEAVFEIRTRQ